MSRYDDNWWRSGNGEAVTIIEKCAPTDESVRILKEMHEKTIDSVIYHGQVSNNDLLDIKWWIIPDRTSWEGRAYFRFKLNNKEITGNFKLLCKYMVSEVPRMIYEKVLSEIANQVSYVLFEKSIETLKDIYGNGKKI